MEFVVIEEGGVKAIEGDPGQPFISRLKDFSLLNETCWSNHVRVVLLYADNLPTEFFDLSSGQAGEMLQRLRNYGLRLAVVAPAQRVKVSSHFMEMVATESRERYFGFFETRDAARAWIGESS